MRCWRCRARRPAPSGPNFHRPAAPASRRSTRATDPATTAAAARRRRSSSRAVRDVAGDWWRLFQLAERSTASSTEALAQQSRSRGGAGEPAGQSQDNLRSGYGIFFPLDRRRCRRRARALRPRATSARTPPAACSTCSLLGATVSYALDLFGGQRRLVEALRRRSRRGAGRRSGPPTLALDLNVVNTVIAEAAYRAEIDATRAAGRSADEQVRIAETRPRPEPCPTPTVLSLRSQLAAAEADASAARAEADADRGPARGPCRARPGRMERRRTSSWPISPCPPIAGQPALRARQPAPRHPGGRGRGARGQRRDRRRDGRHAAQRHA